MLRVADGDGFPIACAISDNVRREMQEMCDIHEVILHGVVAVAFLIPQELEKAGHQLVFAEELAFYG